MSEPYAYGIDPPDRPYYQSMIRREKALVQSDETNDLQTSGTMCVMVVIPPLGFEFGQCAVLRMDPLYPFCVEVSVVGYPGFGVLDKIRGRITKDGRSEEFEFSRDAEAEEIRNAFPPWVRGQMKVTGGQVEVEDGFQPNPDWTPRSSIGIPRFLQTTKRVTTGRLFFGFREQPDIQFAETDPPTEAEIAALGFTESGDPVPIPTDEAGFTTNGDSRVTVRYREVPFLCSPLTRKCSTIVDTTIPSPIAAGALAYAAHVPGMGLQLTSIEPRVFQNLTGVFDRIHYDNSDTEPEIDDPEPEVAP